MMKPYIEVTGKLQVESTDTGLAAKVSSCCRGATPGAVNLGVSSHSG